MTTQAPNKTKKTPFTQVKLTDEDLKLLAPVMSRLGTSSPQQAIRFLVRQQVS